MIIVTDTGTNIRRMMTILEEIDVGSSGDQIFIEPIHYASASDVEKRINELFDVKGGLSGSERLNTANIEGGRRPGTSAPRGAGGPVSLHVAKIVSDDRSNSLIIVATERAYLRMLELIKRIDVPQTGEGEIHVLPLQHADAVDLVKTLTDIITGSPSLRRTIPALSGGGRGGATAAPAAGAGSSANTASSKAA